MRGECELRGKVGSRTEKHGIAIARKPGTKGSKESKKVKQEAMCGDGREQVHEHLHKKDNEARSKL